MPEGDAIFRILKPVHELYSDDSIIRKVHKFIEREGKEVFLFLKYERVENTNNALAYHLSL